MKYKFMFEVELRGNVFESKKRKVILVILVISYLVILVSLEK